MISFLAPVQVQSMTHAKDLRGPQRAVAVESKCAALAKEAQSNCEPTIVRILCAIQRQNVALASEGPATTCNKNVRDKNAPSRLALLTAAVSLCVNRHDSITGVLTIIFHR